MNYKALDKVLFDFYNKEVSNQRDYYNENKYCMDMLFKFNYLDGNKDVCDFYLTPIGMEICKKGGLEKEQIYLQLQKDNIEASNKLIKSTRVTQILTIIIALLTLLIAFLKTKSCC